jgi:hypothetical protein
MPRERHDERLVDEITDVYRTRHVAHVIRRIGSPAISHWAGAWLKMGLGLELLRCSLYGWPHTRIANALYRLGVDRHEITGLATPENPDWKTPFVHLGLPAAEGIADDEPRPAALLDRLIDDRMTELVRDGRGVPFGPEPVAGLLWGLRIEWLDLKLIVTGLAAGLSAETIGEDIRQPYV